MKKFWPLIVLALFIVGTLSVHYVQLAQATSNNTIATLTTVSGDAQFIQNVIIDGTLENTTTYNPIVIKNAKIEPIQHSIFERPLGELFQQLKRDYKAFMRGKTLNIAQFIQTEDALVYVESNGEYKETEMSIYVDALIGDAQATFSVQVPLDKQLSWTTTEHMTLQQQTLTVLTSIMYEDGTQGLQQPYRLLL